MLGTPKIGRRVSCGGLARVQLLSSIPQTQRMNCPILLRPGNFSAHSISKSLTPSRSHAIVITASSLYVATFAFGSTSQSSREEDGTAFRFASESLLSPLVPEYSLLQRRQSENGFGSAKSVLPWTGHSRSSFCIVPAIGENISFMESLVHRNLSPTADALALCSQRASPARISGPLG